MEYTRDGFGATDTSWALSYLVRYYTYFGRKDAFGFISRANESKHSQIPISILLKNILINSTGDYKWAFQNTLQNLDSDPTKKKYADLTNCLGSGCLELYAKLLLRFLKIEDKI